MGIRARLADWVRGKSNSENPDQWFIDWIQGGAKSSAGVVVSQLRAMEEPTCMACVSIRAGDLAKLPVHVYRQRRDGGRVIIKDHPLEKLLRKPNAWQTRLEFIEQMQGALLLKGNAYAAIRRNGRGEAIELIPIQPERVCLLESPDGELFYRVSTGNMHEMAVLRGFSNPIPAADMLHLRWFSFNSLLGLGRMALGKDAIGLSLALEDHSARLFANGTRPGGTMETDKKLDADTIARLKAQLADFQGSENSGKNLFLEQGLKWVRQTMTSVEAETISARRLQIEQIAYGLGNSDLALGGDFGAHLSLGNTS